jgi:hypothetical protein
MDSDDEDYDNPKPRTGRSGSGSDGSGSASAEDILSRTYFYVACSIIFSTLILFMQDLNYLHHRKIR